MKQSGCRLTNSNMPGNQSGHAATSAQGEVIIHELTEDAIAKQRKKSRYRPKPLSNPLELLSRRSHATIEEDEYARLATAYKASLDGLTTDWATENMWHVCARTLNIAQMLHELGVQGAVGQIILDGQNALIRTRDIAKTSGSWKLTTANKFYVQCAFVQHDNQLVHATKVQVIAAIDEVHRRLDAGNIV